MKVSTDIQEEPIEELELDEEVEKSEAVPLSGCWGPGNIVFYGPASRHLLLSGAVTPAMADTLCSQIQQLDAISHDPITMYINTLGGDVISALAIYDMLRVVQSPICTIVNGACFSAGLLILSAGDLRLATPSSLFYYHQVVMSPAEVISGDIFKSTSAFYDGLQTRFDHVLRKRAGMSRTKWKKYFEGQLSKHFNTKKALKYGFIDDQLDYATKPPFTPVGSDDGQ